MSLRSVPAAGEPFLRPSKSRAGVAAGWVAMPVGRWDGEQTKVLFDPRRNSVVLVLDADASRTALDRLRRKGLTCIAAEGKRRLMVGDVAAATRHDLARHDEIARSGRDALSR